MSADKQISELVKASIEADIIKAFREAPQYIDDLVRACLNNEVNKYGGKPDYCDKEKMPYLTYLARETIQRVARTAIENYVTTELGDKIQHQVLESLKSVSVADSFVSAILDSTKNSYQIKILFDKKE